MSPANVATGGHEFELVGSNAPNWNDYVDAHPKGAIFHRAEMQRAFAKTKGHQPFSMAAVNGSGEIVALLASVRVQTLPQLAGRIAARSIFYAEPICNLDAEGQAALGVLLQEHTAQIRTQALFSETRFMQSPGAESRLLSDANYIAEPFLNYLIRLQSDSDSCWGKIAKKMRQKIRATFRNGIEIVDDTSTAGVERMYRLLQHSYGRSRVPLADVSLFHSVLEELPIGTVRIQTALLNQQPVASTISLVYGGRILSWYGGTLRVASMSPFACLVWDEIKRGCEEGNQLYDFGGAGSPNEDYGPRRFKAAFGGDCVEFGRCKLVYSPWRLRLATTAYRSLQRMGLWSGSNRAQSVPPSKLAAKPVAESEIKPEIESDAASEPLQETRL